MAGGRTGVGVGLGVTVALLSTATLALFVLTFIFLGQKQTAQRNLEQYKAETNDLVRDSERNREEVRLLVEEARKEGKSLVGAVREGLAKVAEKVTGASGDTTKSMLAKIEAALAAGGGGGTLMTALSDRDSRISTLTRQLADAEGAAARAREDLQTSTDKVRALEASHAATVKALQADVDRYRSGIDADSKDMQTKVREMQAVIERIKRDASDEKTELNARITRLNEQLLIAQEKIKQLQRDRSSESLRAGDEAALVDGRVVSLESGDGSVIIDRGRRDHVVLGMTFEVYGEAAAIRVDPKTGEYPRGKASVEVIGVDETTSRVRVTRSLRGNPIARGDVLANALYDPNKKYVFLVFGNFDSGDGRLTPEGQGAVKALIEEWGGKVTDALTGDVDFLVLGSRPVLPPPPRPDAPIAMVEEYIRQRQLAERYDELLKQATATSIPVLNQNRLGTLTGK